jgi:ubiquinone/menaquinone biosynthesis C-methylase UbiE
VRFFSRRGNKHALTIAMAGVKLGDRFLQVGCSDSSLLAALAGKVGLSGRACACVTTEEDAARARSGAAHAGILLEVERASLGALPYPDNSFDLVVVDNQGGLISSARPEDRVASLQQLRRTLAPRGRILVIERAARAGLGGLLRGAASPNPHYQSSGGALTALKAEGFKAVRQLAERDGMSFFEGTA